MDNGNLSKLTLPERRRGQRNIKKVRCLLVACKDPTTLAMKRSGKLADGKRSRATEQTVESNKKGSAG